MAEPVNLFGTNVEPVVAFFLLGELVVLVALVVAFLLGRIHKGRAHHYLMLAAFFADLLVFKPLMYSRATSAWGSFPWEGTRIALHLALSATAGILGVIVVILGFKYRTRKGPKMFMPPKGKIHKTTGLLFLAAWAAAFAAGIVIYVEAYLP